MSTFSSGGNPFENIHKDVLESEPEDDEGRARLVDELKSRAKKEFAQKYMPAAARLTQGKCAEALADATEATRLDPAYAKAFYRRGQACDRLKRHAEAVAAYEAGLALEPDSKVFKAALAK